MRLFGEKKRIEHLWTLLQKLRSRREEGSANKWTEVQRKHPIFGENDIRFHTDIDPLQDPDTIHQTVTELAMAMMTTLWGGNEQAVLAMIRALAIADLGVSVNRRQMVGFLDDASGMLEASIRDARRAFEQSGGKVMVFGPGVPPPGSWN